LVRAPGIAPGTADWQTATLLLRHARTYKLGPCRAWAAGWLLGDPIGRSGLRPRIENRRFLKEKGPPWRAEKENTRPASPLNAIRRTARWCRTALAVLRYCSERCPHSRHPPSSPLAGLGAGAIYARRAPSQKRTHTVVPLIRRSPMDWTAAGFARGRWADWLGSAGEAAYGIWKEF
jgi:hypothetical protein